MKYIHNDKHKYTFVSIYNIPNVTTKYKHKKEITDKKVTTEKQTNNSPVFKTCKTDRNNKTLQGKAEMMWLSVVKDKISKNKRCMHITVIYK